MANIQMHKPRVAIDEQSPRIRGRAWMLIRDRIMRRDCGLCQECKRKGMVRRGTEIDHINALTNGGTNDDDNLELLCSECHSAKTDADLGHKPRVTIGLDGWPVDQGRSSEPVWRRQGYR